MQVGWEVLAGVVLLVMLVWEVVRYMVAYLMGKVTREDYITRIQCDGCGVKGDNYDLKKAIEMLQKEQTIFCQRLSVDYVRSERHEKSMDILRSELKDINRKLDKVIFGVLKSYDSGILDNGQ